MTAKKTDSDDDGGVLSGISTSQVTGSALAAVTAAVAGSWLGVAGTLIGAAVGSIVATLAGTIYTNSIRKSRRLADAARMSSLARISPYVARNAAVGDDGPRTAVLAATATGDAADPDAGDDADAFGETPGAEDADTGAKGDADDDSRSLLIRWRGVLAAAVVSLVLALGGIWAYETVVGHPLGESGGSGTTFSNVGNRGSGADSDKQDPKAPSDSETQDAPQESDPSADPTEPSDEATEPTPSAPTETTEPPAPPTPTTSPSTGTDGGSDGGTGSDSDPNLGQPTPAPADGAATPSSVNG